MAEQNKVLVAKSKARSYVTSPMITVIVGTNDQDDDKSRSQTFFVHKDLIMSRSCFFTKALKGYTGSNSIQNEGHKPIDSGIGGISWLEGEEGVVKMPEDEPEVFANYVQLLYYGVIPIFQEIEREEADVHDAVEQEFHMLARIYVLCEKIQDRTTKRLILTAFVEATMTPRADTTCHFLVCSANIRLIYEGTLASDPLRLFITDCYVLRGHSTWVSHIPENLPHDFLYDVMIGLFEHRVVLDEQDKLRVNDVGVYLKKLDVFEEQGAKDGNA